MLARPGESSTRPTQVQGGVPPSSCALTLSAFVAALLLGPLLGVVVPEVGAGVAVVDGSLPVTSWYVGLKPAAGSRNGFTSG